MNNKTFAIMTNLQYSLRKAERRVKSLESGAAYRKINTEKTNQRKRYERALARAKRKVELFNRQISINRNKWFEVFQDVQKECEKRLAAKDRLIMELYKLLAEKDEKIRDLNKQLSEKIDEVVKEREKCNDEKEKNQKLKAQLDQDFTNSSLPSSQTPFRKKVPNNRKKTGLSKGAQPRHKGHARKPLPVTEQPVFIDAPSEIKNNPDFYEQSGPKSTIHKQVISIDISVHVTDYYAKVYRNRKTGAKYHAPFPENVQLDVNYDESIKALVFLLRNHLNVSVDKTQEFLHEVTGGKLNVSHGKIAEINDEFAEKTAPELKDIFAALSSAKVLYADMTCVRHKGKQKNVVVCTDKENVFYAFRDKKGDEGYKDTPVEYCTNTLVHDHDKTLYHYGSDHQECCVHISRYLRGAAENEPDLTWHTKMRDLLLEMNATRDKHNRILTEDQINDFIGRYDEIVDIAAEEYWDNPPSQYYRKGKNLFKMLRDFKDSVLHFLSDPSVDFSNNESERNCRKIKRHAAMSGAFRGDTNKSGEDYCKSMSVLQTSRQKGDNIYEAIKEYFKRPTPERIKKPDEGTEVTEA